MMDGNNPESAGVRLQSVGVVYPGAQPVEALRAVSTRLCRGEFVSIVGPSGCGKSTLLRLIAGLLPHTSGEITLFGQSPQAARRAGQGVGFVFQHPTLLPWRTVRQNLTLPLELGPHPTPIDPGQFDDLLALVGLSDFAHALPHQLSGGMQMRASLARALARRPDLLLLDEPFAALDDITRVRLNEELLGLWQRDRWTGLFVTHNVAEAVYLSQRVLIMSPRPGTLLADVPVPFAYPRAAALRGSAEFAHLVAEISQRLLEAAA
jgi:NitT/TauT family transport system ATP-binding protein